jgi:uncharacterized membrane protein
MPNNSTLPATGDIIASEEISGAKLQRVKLALGAYGTDDGDAGSANPLPVQASALPLPAGASTEATLAALNVIAAAIQSAVVAINTKTTAVNTGAIAGTVALDAPTLAALESITASTGGLTNSELRATALPVSGPLTDGQLRATPVPTEESTTGTHYQPGFDVASGPGAGGSLRTDPDGNLVARAQVLTDELGYRANFANSSLAVSIGSATFTNGSRIVTGTGFIAADMRSDDYCKLDADAESAWMQIESLNSDTQLTLLAPYAGTGGTGASSRAILKPVTGAGGAIAVASGVCTITSGTTANSITEVERDVDWLPLVKQSGVSVSQRIANQTIYIGFYDETTPAAPKWFAWFALDGTTNTTVKCQSARNPTAAPSAAETEETVVTLPNGATTATSRRYRPEVLGDRVNFLIDGVLVATHYRSMPGPGDLLTSTVRVANGAVAPASSTTVTIDFDTVKNHNKLEVGLLSDAEQVVSVQPAAQMFSYSAGAVVIPINTDLLVIDCSQFRSLSILAGAVGTTGVVTGAWSNDGATDWITATLVSEAGATSTTFTGASALLRTTSVRARYFRLRMTTATTAAGATRINVAGFQADLTPAITTQPISGTVTATVTGYPTAAASADALANPTVTQVGAATLIFNGTTWDRARGMSGNLTTGDTGAKTATGNGATIANVGNKGVQVLVNMGAVTGTSPTCVFKLQGSPDGGTSWYDIPGAATASLTATGLFGITVYPGIAATAGTTTTGTTATVSQVMPRTWRVVWTIGGTTPSFTITSILYNYLNN